MALFKNISSCVVSFSRYRIHANATFSDEKYTAEEKRDVEKLIKRGYFAPVTPEVQIPVPPVAPKPVKEEVNIPAKEDNKEKQENIPEQEEPVAKKRTPKARG